MSESEELTSIKIKSLVSSAKSRYRKDTKIQCPAFDNETLRVNAFFWVHLENQKNKRQRTFQDISNRLNALDKMFSIIQTIPYYQDYYKGKDKNTIIHFWTLLATIDRVRYCIVVRKRGKNGNKHIYSIIPNWKGYIPREESSKYELIER